MTKHRRIGFSIAGIAIAGWLVAGSALAQPPRDGNRPPPLPDSTQVAQMVEELARTLALTADQKTAVSALHVAHFAEVRTQMEARHEDRGRHREAMDALRKSFHERVAAQLTDDQNAKYQQFVKERESRRPSEGQRRR